MNGLKNGQALLLENVRFYPEEEKNNKEFSKKLAAPFDLYVPRFPEIFLRYLCSLYCLQVR